MDIDFSSVFVPSGPLNLVMTLPFLYIDSWMLYIKCVLGCVYGMYCKAARIVHH